MRRRPSICAVPKATAKISFAIERAFPIDPAVTTAAVEAKVESRNQKKTSGQAYRKVSFVSDAIASGQTLVRERLAG